LIFNPSEYARGLLFQRFALLVKSVLGLLVGLTRGRWRIPAWILCVLMLLVVPKIRPWSEVINSKNMEVRKVKLGTQDIKHKGKTPIQTYKN